MKSDPSVEKVPEMDRNTPPLPASPQVESLPSGFDELMQHNATTSYPRDPQGVEAPQDYQSQPGSRYGTPAPQAQRPQVAYDGVGIQYQQRGGAGNGQLQGYHRAMYNHDSPYGHIPEAQPYSTPATSPPTPSRASDIMTTRSGTIIHRDTGQTAKTLAPRSSRVEKTKSPAGAKKVKKERAKPAKDMPKLEIPMSEFAGQTVVCDIDAFVNRSAEERHQELATTNKKPHRVKRPMNAFMLYRKAYQLRAKEWASQHNHQVVSRVCGFSWPMESDAVRQQFKTWADTERDNHRKTFPDYKFTPAKPNKQPKYDAHTNSDDHSDLEDFDWATGRPTSRNRSTTKTPIDDMDDDYVPSRSVYGAAMAYQLSQQQHQQHHAMGMLPHQNRSAYEYSNPGKPMPTPYDHRDMTGQFYETYVRNPQRHMPHAGMVEDVMMHKSPSPSLIFQQHHLHHSPQMQTLQGHHGLDLYYQGHSPAGEPQHHQQHHQQQQQQQQQHHQPQQRFEHRIDPSLMPHEAASMLDPSHALDNLLYESSGLANAPAWQTAGTQPGGGGAGSNRGGDSEQQFADAFMSGGGGLDETLALEQHNQYLQGGADEWQIEDLPGDAVAQFDTSWVDPPSSAHKVE
ncbi:hypothetical protein B0H63DRAFT_49222 [Podospora didyma]|uniref:HMG box domain-containing protein n=1 Tax=Podospora didyma TaxID=330526 RepID=A0AAE0U850_9PEZI|nr:hypothetical protein B0H63DRAFT_49222 [Podospora didyma]